jgi:cell wall-associated NlpC family hydrolase
LAWDAEQLTNARLIMAVGHEMGMSQRDVLVGIIAAMQESSLRNLTGGDKDSVGLFQQRGGWGSYSQRHNPMWAAQKFFSTLKGVKGRNGLSLAGAAQAVQRSAYPDAYVKWETDARQIMLANGSNINVPFPLTPPPGGEDPTFYTTSNPMKQPGAEASTTPGVGSPADEKMVPAAPGVSSTTSQPQAPNQPQPAMDINFPNLDSLSPAAGGVRGKILAEGMKFLGTPYSWGGGSLSGPTYGIAQGSGTRGFDCSGLVMYLYNKFGIKMPRVVPDQARAALAQGGTRTSLDKLSPGDLVVAKDGGHIGIYAGNNRMLVAPHTGDVVKVQALGAYQRANMYGIHMNIPMAQSAGRDTLTGMAEAGNESSMVANANANSLQVNPKTPANPAIQAPGINPEQLNDAPQGGDLLNFPGLL